MHRLTKPGGNGHHPAVVGSSPATRRANAAHSRGFTLIEVLIATALTLVLMFMVVTVFATVTDSISTNRAAVEMNDQIRAIMSLLQSDLAGVTCPLTPPLRPEDGQGYFEYIEGPIGPVFLLREAINSSGPGSRPDDRRFGYDFTNTTTVPGFGTLPPRDDIKMPPMWLDGTHGDSDDVLLFTTRNIITPFRGRVAGSSTVTSVVAEVAWFLRGTTLYRRVLLVLPSLEPQLMDTTRFPDNPLSNYGWYARFDLSARQVGGVYDAYDPLGASGSPPDPRLALNSLGDLTKRENRFGHQPHRFPFDSRFWGRLGLPTLRECSFLQDLGDPTTGAWPFPLHRPANAAGLFQTDFDAPFARIWPVATGSTYLDAYVNADNETVELTVDATRGPGFDAWENPNPWKEVDPVTGTLTGFPSPPGKTYGSLRSSEDVVLNNVLAFDVEAWDPGAPVLERTLATDSSAAILPGDADYLFQLSQVGIDDKIRIARFGAYVDLNYLCRISPGTTVATPYGTTPHPDLPPIPGAPESIFAGPGQFRSGLMGTPPAVVPDWDSIRASVYDSGLTHNESDGLDEDGDGVFDEGTDGFDNDVTAAPDMSNPQVNAPTSLGNGVNGVDDLTEMEVPPPYPHPLRGIQIKLRVFEPDTRQIREVTIVQDFATQ